MTRTALYRHYDADGRLLYVGITDCLHGRDRQHVATSAWHKDVVRTETQWCLSREHARALERVAIEHEGPLYNVAQVVRLSAARRAQHREAVAAPIVVEIEAYATARGIAPATVTSRAVQNSRLYEHLRCGGDCTTRTLTRIRDWIAANPVAEKKRAY